MLPTVILNKNYYVLVQLGFAEKCITHKLTKNGVPLVTVSDVTIAVSLHLIEK